MTDEAHARPEPSVSATVATDAVPTEPPSPSATPTDRASQANRSRLAWTGRIADGATVLAALVVAAIAAAAIAAPQPAHAQAEGPATPQAVAAHAEFLATLPAPPGGAGAVCVIDSGVDTTTDLGPALLDRSAFDGGTPDDTGALGDDGTPLPKHGTYVAGIIASQIDGVGTNGIWPAAKILSRRVFTDSDSGATAWDYIRAIDWCLQRRPVPTRVINLSMASLRATLAERAALEDRIAQSRAAPFAANVIAAAGNGGLPYVGYPASGAGVLAIAASGADGQLAEFSNHGLGLDIIAFGSGACVTTSGASRLAVASGTTYAAAVVSAALVALRSYRPDLTPAQAEQLLLDTADVTLAGRVLNAARAFAAVGLSSDERLGRAIPCTASTAGTPDTDAVPRGASRETEAETVRSEAPPRVSVPAGTNRADAPAPVVPVAAAVAGRNPTRRLRPPVIRSVSTRGEILTVRISGRGSASAVFRVARTVQKHGRSAVETSTYLRDGDILRVYAASWKTIRVHLVSGTQRKSRQVTVRANGS